MTRLASADYFTFYVPPPSSRTPMPILQKPRKANQKLMASCFYRAIDAWNSLSPSMRSLDTLSKFKLVLSNNTAQLIRHCIVFNDLNID